MRDLKSMDLNEMTAFMREVGEPAFRGKQVYQWLHRGAASFEEMSNLSKSLREKLSESCFITVPQVERKLVSQQDGTIKYLWRLRDGNCVETVRADALPPRQHGVRLLPGGLPDGLRLLRLHHRR